MVDVGYGNNSRWSFGQIKLQFVTTPTFRCWHIFIKHDGFCALKSVTLNSASIARFTRLTLLIIWANRITVMSLRSGEHLFWMQDSTSKTKFVLLFFQKWCVILVVHGWFSEFCSERDEICSFGMGDMSAFSRGVTRPCACLWVNLGYACIWRRSPLNWTFPSRPSKLEKKLP